MSRLPYSKPALSFDEQLDLLKSRGLVVGNDAQALQLLSTVSYFRLSGYWHPFRERSTSGDRSSDFFKNTRFQQVANLYSFDRALRSLVLDAIESVEIAVRTRVTYQLGISHGPFGHTNPANFHPNFDHTKWIDKLNAEIIRSQDKFIHHYKANYAGFPMLPIWMTTEVMSLGSLSFLCKGLNTTDRKTIARFFDLPPKALTDWMHTITYVRNVCAHHSRLWNRQLAIRTGSMRDPKWQPPITPRNDRLFYVLLMLRHMKRSIGESDDWVAEVNDLLQPIAAKTNFRKAMGIPNEWRMHPLWRT